MKNILQKFSINFLLLIAVLCTNIACMLNPMDGSSIRW
jgi:hypothetical protein